MPKRARELSAIEVKNLEHSGGSQTPDLVAVGGVAGLQLQVTSSGAKSWIYRYSVNGRRRKMGLGAYPSVSLKDARDAARLHQDTIRSVGGDPLAAREEAKAQANAAAQTALKRRFTFADATEAYLEAKIGEFSNAKHRQQWTNTLRSYALPIIGDLPCEDIAVAEVLRVLSPIWETKPETAKRLRGRMEKVLGWSAVHGYRNAENPAQWKGNLETSLKSPSAIQQVSHHPALQIQDLAAWYEKLKGRKGAAARALQFAALTAARSGEVRQAKWEQIDFQARTWTRPAESMKMKREHAVALSEEAIALLRGLPRHQDSNLLFTAPRGGSLSDMALSAVMRRLHNAKEDDDQVGYVDKDSGRPAVPHGLRATFSTWANDHTEFPPDLIEHALAHKVGSDVARAYARGSALQRRFDLMERWADLILGKSTPDQKITADKVVMLNV